MEYNLVGEGNREWLGATLSKRPRTGMLLLTLNDGEEEEKDKKEKLTWAKKVGFKKLSSVINHVHGGNKLILLGFQVPADLSSWKWKKEKEMDDAVAKFKEKEEMKCV
jgi:hypothetical protein